MHPAFRWIIGPMAVYLSCLLLAFVVAILSQIDTWREGLRFAVFAPCFLFPAGIFLYGGVSILRGRMPGEPNLTTPPKSCQ